MEERNILSLASNFHVTFLEYAFQDEHYIYLVMEYLSGGNMGRLLSSQSTLSEEKARFYIAETIMGIQAIHELNHVHRFFLAALFLCLPLVLLLFSCENRLFQ